MTESGFWDSSALVPLCIKQASSVQARALLNQFAITVWWSAPVEVHSAFTRLLRSGQLNQSEVGLARDRLNQIRRDWNEIAPGEHLRELACTLLGLYTLRAADALQLAAALAWCRSHPAGRTFLTADIRLAEAATHAGFTVLRPAAL